MKKLSTIIDNIKGSLYNNNQGYSARKLTALFSILMGAYITKYKLPADAYLHALYAWQLLALICLGIITAQNVLDFKNGKNDTPNNQQTEQ
jgi:hypothetical protein